MRVNVFEGARRIALLLAVLVTGGVLIAASTSEPYLSLNYSVASTNAPFVKTDETCPAGAGSHYFTIDSEAGGAVDVSLCLQTMGFDDEQLVPYKIDEAGTIWGASSYSTEVSEYKGQLEKRFELSPADEAWVDEESSRRYWQNWRDVVKYLFAGLALFWVLVWAIGWIVRGFAGIPMHLDARRQSDS